VGGEGGGEGQKHTAKIYGSMEQKKFGKGKTCEKKKRERRLIKKSPGAEKCLSKTLETLRGKKWGFAGWEKGGKEGGEGKGLGGRWIREVARAESSKTQE